MQIDSNVTVVIQEFKEEDCIDVNPEPVRTLVKENPAPSEEDESISE